MSIIRINYTLNKMLKSISVFTLLLQKEDSKKDEKDKKEDKKEKDKEKEKAKDLTSMQAVAALSVAVIAMGEEIGSEMSTRIFAQLVNIFVQYICIISM